MPTSNAGSRADALSAFHHLTLNTGNVVMQARSGVADRVIDSLLPAIKREAGAVPGMGGWFLDFWFPLTGQRERRSGAGCFQIASRPNQSKAPAVMAVACWDEVVSQEAWEIVRGGYLALKESFLILGTWREMPPRPPKAPWLAVWLTPFAFTDIRTVLMLPLFGDLERCVAWALVEEERRREPSRAAA